MENNSAEAVDQEIKKRQAFEKRGYYLNPDNSFTQDLVQGLLVNNSRYGYQACPCRLASGVKADDLDIICPCDYRDADLQEFGTCFCGLYVSKKIWETKGSIKSIPDRRVIKNKEKNMNQDIEKSDKKTEYPVWRCTVCGYICARSEAPEVCPICGATHDRFEEYSI